jgi:alpha-galactosidase
MDRRNFIKNTGLSLATALISNSIYALGSHKKEQLIKFPDEVSAIINKQPVKLIGKENQHWSYKDLAVILRSNGKGLAVFMQSPQSELSSVTLSWKIAIDKKVVVLNDHWERTYGDVSWHQLKESEILPWYFMEFSGSGTNCFGVKTGCNTFCFWKIDAEKLSLTLDTHSGGNGVKLGDRTLEAAEIITLKGEPGVSPFQTAKRFASMMCDRARMPKQPVYGINDWYFSYGNNSEKLIIQHTEMMAPMAEGLENRPFSVIDAGWFKGPSWSVDDCCWGDNMSTPDSNFKNMARLADKIKEIGMRPGIWTRPLCGDAKSPMSFMLPEIKGREKNKPVLDPTIPENIDKIKQYFKLYNQWEFELVKFDFTSFDLFGKWGFEMLKDHIITEPNWSLHDNSKTNAEIVSDLYHTIRKAAGDTTIIGCNTFSHLTAGVFELNRIGDDTSGNEWDRTRKMGVNTLAFRSIHQGTFYAADGDCVGLTQKVPWEKNKQWMELLAKSGTPLFISAQPNATGAEQKVAIKACFKLASQNLPVAEPLDWIENAHPEKWKLNGEIETFNW